MRPGIKKFHTAIHPVTKQISPGASLLYLCICFLISKMGTRTPHPTCFGKGPADEKLLITRNMFSEALPTPVCSCTAKLWHETVRKVHLINALILLASQQKMRMPRACMYAPFLSVTEETIFQTGREALKPDFSRDPTWGKKPISRTIF